MRSVMIVRRKTSDGLSYFSREWEQVSSKLKIIQNWFDLLLLLSQKKGLTYHSIIN